MSCAISIFVLASSVGSRLNFWNTNPIFDFRKRVRWASDMLVKSSRSMITRPESARVSPPNT
jgi:hypothetical protein